MLSVRAWIADVDWREYRRALAALVPLVFAAATIGWTVGEITDRPPAPPRPPAAAVAGVGAADPVQQHPEPAAPVPVPDAGWPAGQPRHPVAWQPTQATTTAGVAEAVEQDPQAEVQPTPTAGPDTTPTPGGRGQPEPDESPTSQPQPSADPDDDGRGEEPAQARQAGTPAGEATPLDPLPLRQIR